MPVSLSQTKPNRTKLCSNMTVNGVWCSIASPCIRCTTTKKRRNCNAVANYTNLSTFWCSKINCGSATCLFVQANDDQYQTKHTHSATVFQSMHIDFCASSPSIRFSFGVIRLPVVLYAFSLSLFFNCRWTAEGAHL